LLTLQAGAKNAMQNSNIYRQYAADCRRLASGMSEKDRSILMQMAEAWDSRADEAERSENKKKDGGGTDKHAS
jgi:hypothetical protein